MNVIISNNVFILIPPNRGYEPNFSFRGGYGGSNQPQESCKARRGNRI